MPTASRTDWQTPHALFDALWEEYGPFDLDPCCLPEHYTARRILAHGGVIAVPPDCLGVDPPRIVADGLAQRWHGRVYMNPPYGWALRKWVPKAVNEVVVNRAELVVALLPVRTDTWWWQNYLPTHVVNGQNSYYLLESVRFIGGRLKFHGARDSAGSASCIAVWKS